MRTAIGRKHFVVVLSVLTCVVVFASLQPVQGGGQDADLQKQVRDLRKQVEELSRRVDAQQAANTGIRTDVAQRIIALNAQDQKLFQQINAMTAGHQGQLTNHQTQLNSHQTKLENHEQRLKTKGM